MCLVDSKYCGYIRVCYYSIMIKDNSKNNYATKIDLKDLRKEINEDFKTHVGTLYEKFHGDIKLVIERQDGMDRRLERVENKVDLLTETVGDIKVEVTGNGLELDDKVNRSEHKGLEQRVVALEAKA